ncbi:MAG: DinB family protein [Gemmatimonadales bacterium]
MSGAAAAVPPVRAVLLRDLAAFRREIEAYPDDDSVWACPAGFPNSAGTLALHVAGNLQHFVGAILGASGYVRDRTAEFAGRGVPRVELARRLQEAEEAVRLGLDGRALPEQYPGPAGGGGMTVRTDEWLVHLAVHLTYHLGQVDYHRRAVTCSSVAVGALATAELPSARTP